jgi:hypothetical protein
MVAITAFPAGADFGYRHGVMASDDREYRIRMALAAQAYDANAVRLQHRDLRNFDHIVASRQGLYAVRPNVSQLIAYGQFYGISINRDAIYVFEACGQPRRRTNLGRIVCLRLKDGQIESAEVIVRGIDNGCHQIDLIDGQLYITDTYNQRLLRMSSEGGEVESLYPLPLPDPLTNDGYAHVNSVLAAGDAFYLLKHNNGVRSGIDSEIAVFDRQWQLVDTVPLAGRGCHNLAVMDDGSLISCGSLAGELVIPGRASIKVCDRMTRGLSIGADQIVVGGSAVLARDLRDQSQGEVYFLNREFQQTGSVMIAGPVMEIRRIDGRDRSLSAHLGRGH